MPPLNLKFTRSQARAVVAEHSVTGISMSALRTDVLGGGRARCFAKYLLILFTTERRDSPGARHIELGHAIFTGGILPQLDCRYCRGARRAPRKGWPPRPDRRLESGRQVRGRFRQSAETRRQDLPSGQRRENHERPKEDR